VAKLKRVGRRCLRCGRYKRADGLLLCSTCAPLEGLQQSVDITAPTAFLVREPDGRLVQLETDATGKIKVKAKGRRGRLEAGVIDGEWVHDRQGHEVREHVYDKDADFYSKHYRKSDTDQLTWKKVGKLSDPKMHGKASHRPSSTTSESSPEPSGRARVPPKR